VYELFLILTVVDTDGDDGRPEGKVQRCAEAELSSA
jgi:hypothetical protein